MKITKILMLALLIISMIMSVSCNENITSEKPDISFIPNETAFSAEDDIENCNKDLIPEKINPSEPILEDIEKKIDYVTINILTTPDYGPYDYIEEYYYDKYEYGIKVNNYTGKAGTLFNKHTETGSFYRQFDPYTKDTDRDGIYLFNLLQYFHYIHARWNEFMGHNYPEETDALRTLCHPYNGLEVVNMMNPMLYEAFTDNDGIIWGLPYEYKYPDVKIRKYNESVLKQINSETPETLDDLLQLLIMVKSETEINEVLPAMKRGDVFSGFEDIVNAYGIKTSLEVGSFYSIQFDNEQDKFVDIAFTGKMHDCIEFFTVLINLGFIDIDESYHSSSEDLYQGNIFSVYDLVEKDEDVSVPYTSRLQADGYKAKLFFMPSRYVYIIGRDQKMGKDLDAVLQSLYVETESYLTARYGVENTNFEILDGQVVISKDEYQKALMLIGEFPEMPKLFDSRSSLRNFKEKITKENVGSGYYSALTPNAFAMEIQYDTPLIEELKMDVEGSIRHETAYKFYQMLSEHFFNPERPSTEDFLIEYRVIMSELFQDDIVNCYFVDGEFLETDLSY